MAIWDKVKSFGGGLRDVMVGKDPSSIAAPEGAAAAQAQRDALIAELSEQGPSDAARMAVEAAQENALGRVAASQMSAAAGARGLGVLGARRGAARNMAIGQANVAGQMAPQAIAAASADEQADMARRALMAQLLGQQEASAYGLEQYRQQQAGSGLVPGLLTIGGGLIGGKLGGAQGAQAGAQFGGGLGMELSRQF